MRVYPKKISKHLWLISHHSPSVVLTAPNNFLGKVPLLFSDWGRAVLGLRGILSMVLTLPEELPVLEPPTTRSKSEKKYYSLH